MAGSRFRSVRYDLAASLEVARMAGSAGGSIAPDLLAPALGYSGTNNGAYLSRVAKARSAADQLVASAGQAGLILRSEMGKLQLTTSVTNFTPVDNSASLIQVPQLRWRRGKRSSTGGTVAMGEDGLWLDEESDRGSKQPRSWRRAGIAGAAALI